MKKITALLMAAVLTMGLLAGCGSKASGGSGESIVGTDGLSGVIDKIYEKQSVDVKVGTMDVDLDDKDALKAYTGLDSADGIKAAAASEALIGSQAYSLVLVQVEDSAKAEATAEAMKSGINPAKWICVQANDVKLAVKGDVVLLVMVDSELGIQANDLIGAFKTVCGGSLDKELG